MPKDNFSALLLAPTFATVHLYIVRSQHLHELHILVYYLVQGEYCRGESGRALSARKDVNSLTE